MKPKLCGFVEDVVLVGIGCGRLSGMEQKCVVLEELYKKGRCIPFSRKFGEET